MKEPEIYTLTAEKRSPTTFNCGKSFLDGADISDVDDLQPEEVAKFYKEIAGNLQNIQDEMFGSSIAVNHDKSWWQSVKDAFKSGKRSGGVGGFFKGCWEAVKTGWRKTPTWIKGVALLAGAYYFWPTFHIANIAGNGLAGHKAVYLTLRDIMLNPLPNMTTGVPEFLTLGGLGVGFVVRGLWEKVKEIMDEAYNIGPKRKNKGDFSEQSLSDMLFRTIESIDAEERKMQKQTDNINNKNDNKINNENIDNENILKQKKSFLKLILLIRNFTHPLLSQHVTEYLHNTRMLYINLINKKIPDIINNNENDKNKEQQGLSNISMTQEEIEEILNIMNNNSENIKNLNNMDKDKNLIES